MGRQRWRIRGKIESDDTQCWDEEEMVFLPYIHHNFEIKVQTNVHGQEFSGGNVKYVCVCAGISPVHLHLALQVTEAKGLGWQMVGTVTCASADFFVARPQLMLVDITELGTIKLQLEVTWKYEHTLTHHNKSRVEIQ